MRLLKSKGFTVIDIMLAIAIVAILGVAVMPIANGYITRGGLDSASRDIVAALRYAQIQSEAGVDNATWGVNVGSGVITTFQGTSYATRLAAYDQTTEYPINTVVSGISEYVFTELTGRTTGGSLTLTSPSTLTKTITVNAVGMIDF